MSYLIDINVLSELRRKTPDPAVARWFADRRAGTLYLSLLTLGELRKGIERLADPARRIALLDWLETELSAFFAGTLLAIDAAVADRWGHLQARAGRPLPAIDSLLAATAMHHGLIFVTRNVRVVAGLGVQLLNPWD